MKTDTLLLLVLAVAECACGDNLIPKAEACDEQADAWCERAGYPTGGCRNVYRQWCMNGGTYGAVDEAEQEACLEEIETGPCAECVPDACARSW